MARTGKAGTTSPVVGRRRLAYVVLIMFIGGASAVLLARHLATEEAPVPFDEAPFDLRLFDPTDPNEALLQPGDKVTLESADSVTAFPLIRPQHKDASDDSLMEVWVATGGAQEVALRYSSGVRAYLAAWPDDDGDPAAFYKQSASESGAGSFQEINGHPAWVVEANSQAPGFPEHPFVLLTVGNVEIDLQGLPLQELVDIAKTVS